MVLSEYGPDLSRFPTEKQFISQSASRPTNPSAEANP